MGQIEKIEREEDIARGEREGEKEIEEIERNRKREKEGEMDRKERKD